MYTIADPRCSVSLLLLPRYRPSQPQTVSYSCVASDPHPPTPHVLCGDRYRWLCWKSFSSSVLLMLSRGWMSQLAASVGTKGNVFATESIKGIRYFLPTICPQIKRPIACANEPLWRNMLFIAPSIKCGKVTFGFAQGNVNTTASVLFIPFFPPQICIKAVIN